MDIPPGDKTNKNKTPSQCIQIPELRLPTCCHCSLVACGWQLLEQALLSCCLGGFRSEMNEQKSG